MSQQVTMPDGSLHNFPDEATPEMMQAALGAPQADPINGAGRLWQGVQDIPNGMAQLGLHAAQSLPDGMLNAVPGLKGADQYIDNQLMSNNSNYEGRRAAAGSDGVDWYRMGGNAIASAPLVAALPGAGAETLAGRAGAGVLQGAAAGAAQPDNDAANGNYWTDKAYQTAGGAATGGILNPALGAAGAAIAPKVSSAAQYLMDNGVTPTIGQILGGSAKSLEEKMTSIPGVGDAINSAYARGLRQFNSTVLNDAVSGIGGNVTKTGRDGVQQVSDQLGAAYNDVLPRLNLTKNNQLITDINTAYATLQPAQAKQFSTIMDGQLGKFTQPSQSGGAPTMTGDTLKGFQSEISRHARGYQGDASYDQQQLGDALDQVSQAIRTNLAQSNPGDAELLNNINAGYAKYARIRTAGQKATSDRGFTPAELAQAIRQNDQSVGNGQFARGNAPLQNFSDPGVEVLGGKFPESGTFARHAVGAGVASMLGEGAGVPHEAMLAAATATGLGSLPYMSEGTQKLAAALLAKRPGFARPVSDAAQFLAPYASAGAAGSSQR